MCNNINEGFFDGSHRANKPTIYLPEVELLKINLEDFLERCETSGHAEIVILFPYTDTTYHNYMCKNMEERRKLYKKVLDEMSEDYDKMPGYMGINIVGMSKTQVEELIRNVSNVFPQDGSNPYVHLYLRIHDFIPGKYEQILDLLKLQ